MQASAHAAAAEAAAAPVAPNAPDAAPQNSLLGLPEELLHLVADALLHKHLPSALRLNQACTALRGRLAAVRAAAEARRLRWVPELMDTDRLAISDEGRKLTVAGGRHHGSWAAGPLLPTAGRVSFSVRIEESGRDWSEYQNAGADMYIGVCNEANDCAWGLHPYNGKLGRRSRDAGGMVPTAPPANYPDGHHTQVMVNEAGRPAHLRGRANGAVIEVVVDHSDGSLAFGVNGAPPRRVPDQWSQWQVDDSEEDEPTKVPFKFPQGAQLRPWVAAAYPDEQLCFARGYN